MSWAKFFGTPPPIMNRPVCGILDLQQSEFVKVFAAVDADGWLAGCRPGVNVGDEAEPGRAVAERRTEDRDVLLICLGHDAVGGLAVLLEIGSHLADDFAGAVGARLHAVDDLLHRLIADAKLFLVDERVVNAVDHADRGACRRSGRS